MDGDLKSAYELAMERLGARDDTAGASLTDEQKTRIATIRNEFKARLDEAEFLHQNAVKKAAAAGTPEKILDLEADYGRERARLEEERDRRIQEVRGPAKP